MKAMVYTKYGSPDVLELKEVAKPTPKDNEVLVKVLAIAVNAGDLHLLRADPFPIRLMSGFLKPKINILGSDVAGRVEAVGGNVTQFQAGDEVFGNVSGYGWGAFAEYVCANEDAFVPKPSRLTFEEAAAVSMAGVTALQGLRDRGHIQAGQKVLINGASGGVGTFAVQIAKSFGAEVTAVCSTRNVDMARSIVADTVIDYTQEDCCVCPAQPKCTRSKLSIRHLLLLPQSQYEALQKARQEQKTSAFWKKYAKRSGIEGTISQGVRAFDLRFSRYVGLAKTHLQMVGSATAMNLYRLYNWVNGVPHALTRTASFARLAPDPSLVSSGWRA